MKNLLRNLLSSCLTTLLVLTFACTKPNFVRITNDVGGAGAGGDSGGAGAGGDSGGAGAGGDSADAGGGGAAGGAAAAGGSGGGGGAGDASVGPDCSATPVPFCVPSIPAPCDPVCQTGSCDWCTKKCTYAIAGATAQPTCAGKGQQPVFQPCQVFSSGTASQNDNCAPGSICLQPISAGSCFTLCRSTLDCPSGVDCGQRYLSSPSLNVVVKVCDPYPYDQCGPGGTCCDPFGGSGGCAKDRYCFLVSPDKTGHSRTVCEFSPGGGQHGTFCSSAHDCMLANSCVNSFCRQVCDGVHPCPPGGGVCTPWGAEYSYCL